MMRRFATLSGQIFTPWAVCAGGVEVELVLGVEEGGEGEDDSNGLELLVERVVRLEELDGGGEGGADCAFKM